MVSQNELKKTARQYQIEERSIQVGIMIAQDMTEGDVAAKLGVDNTTKSDFTYYYLETVKLVVRKQWEIVNTEGKLTKEDIYKTKVLADILQPQPNSSALR